MTRGEGRGGQWWKDEEGTSQRACMKDPGTWATVWGLTVGARGGGGLGKGGKKWDNHNRITIKKDLIKKIISNISKKSEVVFTMYITVLIFD